MPNLYPGHKPSYGFGRLLVILLLAGSFPCYLFAQPTITSFSPASGPVGTIVTITGTNFSATPSSNIVYFGTVQTPVSAASATSLTVTVPAGTSYQPLTVTIGGRTCFSALPFITTFADPGQFITSAFAEKNDIPTGDDPQGVSSADFDGDGKPDLVIANGNGNTIYAFKNNSIAGTISFALQYNHTMNVNAGIPDLPMGVTTGDLDGDGKPDLVITNNNSSTIAVFLNTSTTGSISFATPIYYNVDANSNPSVATIADLNGDGKPEIIVASSGTDALAIYPNTSIPGSLSFSSSQDLSLPPGSLPMGVVAADLDGDGKPDLATENSGTGLVSVFRNTSIVNGAISFTGNTDFAVGSGPTSTPMGLAAGDLDGDGKTDLVVTNSSDITVSLLRNTSASGAISFDPQIIQPMAGVPQGIGIADLDGDGKPDLAITDWSDGKVSVFRNTSTSGNISVATGIYYTVGSIAQNITVADLDGDGLPDLATSNNFDKTISVLRNKASQGPVISSFTPVVGIAGTVVTITGTNLNAATDVSFGGTPATFTVVSATKITATLGGGATGAVSVTTAAGTGSLNGFTFGVSVPVISSFTPSSGMTGATISITGSGLSAVTLINFGGVQATNIIVTSDNLITAKVGAGATGKISIFSPYGADSLGVFTYIDNTPPPPVVLDITAFLPATGKTGDPITIKGKSLTGTTAVSFGGTPAQSFNILSDSVIVAFVGTGTTGQLLVTGASGMDSLPGFTYQAAPPPPPVYQINSFSPASAKEGTTITITGSSLTGATTVSFGGTPAASFTVISDNTITAIIGPGASGQVKVTGPSWQDSLAGFSFIKDTVATPPPIQQAPFQLQQFTVTLSGSQALVQWSAINEKRIAYYVVERGTDSTEFNDLTSTQPNTKDAGAHNYVFTDLTPLPGISYYRIKMVDTSNASTYSNTIALQIAVKIAVQLSMYPNPVKYGFTYVALPATGRPSRFEVTDMSGKVLKTQSVSANNILVRVDMSGVIRGTYKLIWSDGVHYSWQTIVVL